ncbi:hypothetical protein FFLO_04345 [Filobasidium floriforme]|uniref:Dol-P-Man:Man(5)GlcNAc(2)-PP-Dol alpha-1,3-mannosyltransferase n=1 Tax=Filobasidium floriforme TaxID=5210 RepID=A0A8K0NPC6_9TREE|nr:hypothetical protein FFLO_04345 [Filobasidium floriforme]
MSRGPLSAADGPLVWIPFITLGLDHEKERIIEIAVIITDGELNPVDDGIEYVIRTDKEILDAMGEWCVKTHGESGLTQACIDSPHSYEQVEGYVYEYIKRWVPDVRVGVLAGSSVHADARFLSKGMPRVMQHLHYRIVDVSSIKELARRWYPESLKRAEVVHQRGPRSAHRALDDIRASIEELKIYRQSVFLTKEEFAVRNQSAAVKHTQAVTSDSFVGTCIGYIGGMLYDPRMYPVFVGLWLAGETVLSSLVIRFVSYTNIDYLAYTQQATLFLSPNNERTYSKLVGDTGPLVYPALHLYIYSFLHKMFPRASLVDVAGFVPGTNSTLNAMEEGAVKGGTGDPGGLLPLQLIWLGLYIATLFLIAVISGQADSYMQSRRAPSARWITSPRALVDRLMNGPAPLPLLLGALSLSLRLHSIYVLRLFNDPIAMLLLYSSVWLFTKKKWKIGSIVYSLALGVKMNILLFLPGLLVLLFQYQGIAHGAICGGLILAVQIALAAPFLTSPGLAKDYFTSAFDLSRAFLFKWSVNWNFVGQETFDSGGFKRVLLLGQVTTLVLFAWFKWSGNVKGGTAAVLRRGILGSWWHAPVYQGSESAYHIPLVLFTSNLIGITFARSLHYQFFSWYAHQMPFLLWTQGCPIWMVMLVWTGICNAWNVFPPSKLMSFSLFCVHVGTLIGVWRGGYRILHRASVDTKQS